MLESLIKRLNKDDIDEMKDNALFENVDFTDIPESYSKEDLDELESALECVSITEDNSLDSAIDRLVEAAADPDKILTESIVNTSKNITMTNDDFTEMVVLTNDYSTLKGEEKITALKKIKSFVNSVLRNIRECSDDNPTDAKILGICKKLCRIFDIKYNNTAETRKLQIIESLTQLKKSLKNK